ncbi:ADL265W-Ap [Eremothecium gossypii ATCC 10895]|uniref:ADL265W-Ap n=1 Tax=Eremothecium gossypii (strain ATCC 10895 / CBS 109.51 / FGSC 9923 / NRRL Y-1056) TaxID=284811 RepID=D8FGB8_EREGS|nr:ADL265W-Ap [Eremothecium gossypii ATCC 10895]ADJ41761.1 ADL265W-Ap [Eremothecium gossypii ATCC 10895]AEY95952.1 FADL265W-Ap [Eremothecium gossypii FDAG1]
MRINVRIAKILGAVGILLVTASVLIYGTGISYNPSMRTLHGSGNNKGNIYRTVTEQEVAPMKREKATFVTLARNSDLYTLLESIMSVEDRFNHKFKYDWVFLNDEEFTDTFKALTSALVSGNTYYGKVPKEHWSFPEWIDQDRAARVRQMMAEKNVIYGDSINYRFMCRYESGLFYRHELLQPYDYYWRVEPEVRFFCDVDYDVFRFMRDNNKKYGFTISIHEYPATIETLWEETRKFMEKHPEHVHPNNMMDFISDDNGLSYNMCHFWSNFEIGSLEFLRSKAYSDYFDSLDQAGGFFYERWGDAPVHSIAAALFLDRNEIHHFNDIGYFHPPFQQCPIDETFRKEHRCACNADKDFTWNSFSCGSKFYDVNKMKKPAGWYDYVSRNP